MNANCDGAGPHNLKMGIRKYPIGHGNALLCVNCVHRENLFRAHMRDGMRDKREAWKAWPNQPWPTLEKVGD